jgi:hypothetical protein
MPKTFRVLLSVFCFAINLLRLLSSETPEYEKQTEEFDDVKYSGILFVTNSPVDSLICLLS